MGSWRLSITNQLGSARFGKELLWKIYISLSLGIDHINHTNVKCQKAWKPIYIPLKYWYSLHHHNWYIWLTRNHEQQFRNIQLLALLLNYSAMLLQLTYSSDPQFHNRYVAATLQCQKMKLAFSCDKDYNCWYSSSFGQSWNWSN